MIKKISSLSILFILLGTFAVVAQNTRLGNSSLQFRDASRFVRVAEPGQLADSVNIWGDVGYSGRYLLPKGTTLPEFISFAGGVSTISGQTVIDWSKMRVEIFIHEPDSSTNGYTVKGFKYRFEEPFPDEMMSLRLTTDQTVTVRVKRKASFRDYVGVIAPAISAIATTFLALERLSRL